MKTNSDVSTVEWFIIIFVSLCIYLLPAKVYAETKLEYGLHVLVKAKHCNEVLQGQLEQDIEMIAQQIGQLARSEGMSIDTLLGRYNELAGSYTYMDTTDCVLFMLQFKPKGQSL